MKKLLLLSLSLGAIIMSSCANEELVKAPVAGNDNQGTSPMGFSIYMPNMNRAGGATALQSTYYDFAIWANKIMADDSENTVMDQYLVGYFDQDNNWGYKPLNNQLLTTDGSLWFYEGLGKLQAAAHVIDGVNYGAAYEFLTGGVQTAANTSARDYQYLKYWDPAATSTMFYGATPYNSVKKFENHALYFNTISPATGSNFMYAVAQCNNAQYIANKTKVSLTFYRLGAQIRLAFYEMIPGWDVELLDYSATYEGIWAVPVTATETATTDAGVTTYSYSNFQADGEYAYQADPVVTFTGVTPKVTYENSTPSTDNMQFALQLRHLNADGVWADTPLTTTLGTSRNDAIYTNTTAVVPADTDNPNCGFTFNVSFKLVAQGTGEEIIVRGARVYIPWRYTQWEPNHLYTYIFKVTDKVPGTPSVDEPDPEPTDPYLLPIIFDDIKVEALTDNEEESEWDLN